MHLFDHTTGNTCSPLIPGAPFVESASLRSCQTSSFSLEFSSRILEISRSSWAC